MSKESISSVTGARDASGETTNSFAGKWALITGASSGLGLDFADLLAAQKVNLVLAARRQEPMEKLASDLRRDLCAQIVSLDRYGLQDLSAALVDGLRALFRATRRRARCGGRLRALLRRVGAGPRFTPAAPAPKADGRVTEPSL